MAAPTFRFYLFISMIMLMILFLLLVIQHELNVKQHPDSFQKTKHIGNQGMIPGKDTGTKLQPNLEQPKDIPKEKKKGRKEEEKIAHGVHSKSEHSKSEHGSVEGKSEHSLKSKHSHLNHAKVEKKGSLTCDGKSVDSETIYWKVYPGDNEYESPITPHHGMHHDRYLSFEYDGGGWNNVRMSMECYIVVAHAMGRTLVVPPQEHLYLLRTHHKDPGDEEAHDEMGFEDFFDIDLLRQHKGFHLLHMEEFLAKEGVTGGLRDRLPPGNKTDIWGRELWEYMNKVADVKPEWAGRFIAFPGKAGDHELEDALKEPEVMKRYMKFGGDRISLGRPTIFYDTVLQNQHHIHFPAFQKHRVLQHHYAFTFFTDPKMTSFYRRFVRDYMRYKDHIQCAGAQLVAAIRKESRRIAPEQQGDYYSLHIRRGDFQYKDVKISASDIFRNLHHPNGTAIYPAGAVVYISTDDPDGVCKNCHVKGKSCLTIADRATIVGCGGADPSWKAFETEAKWKILFLKDFMKRGLLKDVNPNIYGMVESIACSRAKVFAGTWWSTFTGYIHRLRGYHGLGEDSYYHTNKKTFDMRSSRSVGHGFWREWRSGWTDDGGQLI